ARLNGDGTLDSAFDPNANDLVLSITVQADGNILAGGAFTTIGGFAQSRITRIRPDGTFDTPDLFANATVDSTALQADGKILTGGAFTTIGGQARNHFARLSLNAVALQNLAAT